ncbi:MAG: rbsC [Nocardioides sp.]|nr:rbsC [Nocardioides sp.]
MSTDQSKARVSVLERAGYRLLLDPTLGVQAMLVTICVVAAFSFPVFLTEVNLYNVVGSSIIVMLLALGMTVVLIARGIDLSVGAVMALCAAVTAEALLNGYPLTLAAPMALATGAAVGIANGLLITKLGLPDFIATLAMLGFASGILYIWTGGVPIIGYMVPEFYYVGGLTPLVGSVTVPMLIALVLALVLGGLLGWSRLGTHLFAVGSSEHSARQSGVAVHRVRILAYVISGLMAAVAGIVIAGRNTNVPADLGTGYEIQAIAAAVIGGASLGGGRGRILGAVLGALTLAVSINLINLLGVPSSYQKIVIGAILLLAVVANRLSEIVNAWARRRRLARAPVDHEADAPDLGPPTVPAESLKPTRKALR